MAKFTFIPGNKQTAKGAGMQKKPKKKTAMPPMHKRLAAAMSKTRVSTPPEPNEDDY